MGVHIWEAAQLRSLATRNVPAFLDRLLIKPAAILGFRLLEKAQIQS